MIYGAILFAVELHTNNLRVQYIMCCTITATWNENIEKQYHIVGTLYGRGEYK